MSLKICISQFSSPFYSKHIKIELFLGMDDNACVHAHKARGSHQGSVLLYSSILTPPAPAPFPESKDGQQASENCFKLVLLRHAWVFRMVTGDLNLGP